MSSKTLSSRRKRIQANNSADENRLSYILGPFDKWLFVIISILCVFGLICVFSASGPAAIREYNDPFYFLKKQILFDILGFGLMFVISRIDYKVYRVLGIPISLAVCGLVLATYFIGVNAFGGERWLKFGPLTFQPSEFGKIAAIILAAEAMSYSKNIFDLKFIFNFLIIGAMILLILKQPSLSIALITSASTVVVMFMGGFPLFILIPAVIVGFLGVAHVIKHTPYQLARILGWLNPWEDPQNKGYNIIQSWYAFGSGGVLGVGFGNSKQKLYYLPFNHTDFIFAIIAEEFGLIGAIILIGFFVAFALRGFIISNNCEDKFGKLLAIGITCSIAIQAFINMGVASGVIPPTGVTLPLVSYGGSSSLAIFFMLGILLNISRKRIQRLPVSCS